MADEDAGKSCRGRMRVERDQGSRSENVGIPRLTLSLLSSQWFKTHDDCVLTGKEALRMSDRSAGPGRLTFEHPKARNARLGVLGPKKKIDISCRSGMMRLMLGQS